MIFNVLNDKILHSSGQHSMVICLLKNNIRYLTHKNRPKTSFKAIKKYKHLIFKGNYPINQFRIKIKKIPVNIV